MRNGDFTHTNSVVCPDFNLRKQLENIDSKWKLSMFITLSRFAKNLKKKKLLILECFRFVFFFFSSVERMLHDFTGRLNDKS